MFPFKKYNLKTHLFISSVFIIFVLAPALPSCWLDSREKLTDRIHSDLKKHPIYSRYTFGQDQKIIDIGIQPLYSPTGLITAAIKRDRILRKNLKKNQYRLKFHSFLKGDDVNYFLENGKLEAGVVGDMPAITAAARLQIVIPALFQKGFISIVSRHPMMIENLRGRRIGYPRGSNAHYALLKALSKENLSIRDVELIPIEVHNMPETLEKGDIDAFSAWEPIPTRALKRCPNCSIIQRVLSFGFIYFSAAHFKSKPEVFHHILAAEIRALRWMKADKRNLFLAARWAIQEGQALTGKSGELSIEQIAELALQDIIGLSVVPMIPEYLVQKKGFLYEEFLFLKRIKKIDKNVHWNDVQKKFKRKILKHIVDRPKKYSLFEFNYDKTLPSAK